MRSSLELAIARKKRNISPRISGGMWFMVAIYSSDRDGGLCSESHYVYNLPNSGKTDYINRLQNIYLLRLVFVGDQLVINQDCYKKEKEKVDG